MRASTRRGGVEAGLLIARICMGGLGRVARRMSEQAEPFWPSLIEVHTSTPVLACLGSQYAGWSLAASKEETGGKKFFSLGSGPARALAVKEPLFDELGYRDRHERGALVMEVDRLPPQVVIDKVLRDCALAPDNLTIIVTPTHSVAGTVQVVARVVEVALHKTHVLGVRSRRDRRRQRHGAVAAARARRHPGDGPHQRRDSLRRPRAPHREARRGGRASRRASCRRAMRATTGGPFADIFTSFNYDFYQIDRRALRARRSVGEQPRKRRDVARRTGR